MINDITWSYDLITTKNGNQYKSVLYGNDCFIISTHSNRLLSTDLEKAEKVTLLYIGEYCEHRYWETLEQMMALSQQIFDNTDLFKRFIYLDCRYTNYESNWRGKGIDFNSL